MHFLCFVASATVVGESLISWLWGDVTRIAMAFQFGMNWKMLSERTGPIQAPLLGYEASTALLPRRRSSVSCL
jgi:cytochrome bd-type quinol oxidase subunit 1